MTEYWYNVRTAQIEEGPQSSWKHLLGPYATPEDAAAALERVKANNERWDEEEENDDAR
ncbi:SPOR domain-containing protein [Nesterenkonia flava]|uniref:SPOR domain-containing protein n=1 Tax=Nesterenkonia flava TaxID=469799 RepID=A0ABU1FPF2_9MICC|nr:SPOR domain-containing protein [Nesterenkonia flava]MDR5710529.1 SPOR domain-containing protein [Nesterenkonia flava]